ncbi:transcriptional regulator [Neobacillus sp. OS1-2]|uniref:transcriptional regulator n=1 Tax=Neobacillus sp. OS1-2 TaxID=3070680 RepID=UPI0027DF4C2B|nr:transcriptional regulator [Neobacillus sp. OS1-2]WML37943.1 transcriptional regulator [Neobacillus sp. OS1-2]
MHDMETIIIEKDIKVFYLTATSFPDGIQDAHDRLHASIPFSNERRYFGISRPEMGVITYKAAAEIVEKDKEGNFNGELFTIEKGKYRCVTIVNYKKEPQKISHAFEELISYSDIDPNGYCVEWYQGNEDLKCMVRLNPSIESD